MQISQYSDALWPASLAVVADHTRPPKWKARWLMMYSKSRQVPLLQNPRKSILI